MVVTVVGVISVLTTTKYIRQGMRKPAQTAVNKGHIDLCVK